MPIHELRETIQGTVTLDEEGNFVITGIGQEILGVEFTSATGAIRVGTELPSAG